MVRSVDNVLNSMPAKRRKKIEARADELIAEQMSMIELRKAKEKTQVELAKLLGVQQTTVSRMEKRSDMYISTLRGFIEAMGGNLDLVAKFPNRPDVHIEGLTDIQGAKTV
jgi:DNA-binding XRE family transcriptional regulator